MVIRVEISSKEIADLATLLQGQPKEKTTIDDVANAIVEGFKDSIHRDSNRIYNQPSEGMEPTLTKD